MHLIGLAGASRAGKDVIASMMAAKHGYTRHALATPLKDLCQGMFGLSNEQVHGGLREVVDARYNMTPRRILQTVGTDCVRAISPDHWVDAFEATHFPLDFRAKVVVTDIRFQNEADAIKRLGGSVFLVTRECCDACDRHASEQAHLIQGVDGVIRNVGTIDDLLLMAQRVIGLPREVRATST